MRAGDIVGKLRHITLGASLLLGACGPAPEPPDPRALTPQVAFDAALLDVLERLDPLPTIEARKVVLAVQGIPIRRGDFDRILDYWLPTLPGDTALVTLREAALLNELLPRAMALHATGIETLRSIAGIIESQRDESGRFALDRLAAAWAAHSAAASDTGEIFELQVERKRNAQPLIAAAGSRLARAADQVGPIVTRDGVFVFERTATSGIVGPELPSANERSEAALWVRAAALVWPIEARTSDGARWLSGAAARLHIDALVRSAVRERLVQVLDPEYAAAVPPWLPEPK